MALTPATPTLFRCSSCTKDFFRAATSLHPNLFEGRDVLSQRALHSTLASIRKGHHRRELVKAIETSAKGKELPWSTKRHKYGPVKWERKSLRARALNTSQEVIEKPEGATLNLFTELSYTRDPLTIANIVHRGLRDGQRDQALEIARIVSKEGVYNVVSWNHIIDYDMERGAPRRAMEVYKEMKERNCRPDSHTYTIVLRGLARHADHATKSFNAVEQAMKIYDSIKAKGSGVRATTIHTNALLLVCARSGDKDALWKAAGMFAEGGKGSPDSRTYTTILNALLSTASPATDAESNSADKAETPYESPRISPELLKDAEAIWDDVMERWNAGELQIDEALVNAMARLYIQSPDRVDQSAVFELVKETMDLQLADAPPTEASSDTSNAAGDSNLKVEQGQLGINGRQRSGKTSVRYKPMGNENIKPEFAIPTQRTLSMLVGACTQLGLKRAASHYWTLLTSRHGRYQVIPDAANYMDYLRCLRRSRSSNEVASLLSTMNSEGTISRLSPLQSPGMFSIAISTCQRDIWNRSSFHNASVILDVMTSTLPPGPKSKASPSTLQSFLELAIGPQSGAQDTRSPSRHTRPNMTTSSRNLIKALNHLVPYMKNFPSTQTTELLRLTTDAVGAIDRILLQSSKSSNSTEEKPSTIEDPLVLQDLKEMKRTISSMESKARSLQHSLYQNNGEKTGLEAKKEEETPGPRFSMSSRTNKSTPRRTSRYSSSSSSSSSSSPSSRTRRKAQWPSTSSITPDERSSRRQEDPSPRTPSFWKGLEENRTGGGNEKERPEFSV